MFDKSKNTAQLDFKKSTKSKSKAEEIIFKLGKQFLTLWFSKSVHKSEKANNVARSC